MVLLQCHPSRTGLSPANAGWESGVQNNCRIEKHYAQRHSKVSESDGCPSGYAGRMDRDGRRVQNGFSAVPPVPDGCPKSG